MPAATPEPPGQSPASAVSNMIVRVFSEYTGRGPTKARTYLNDDLVTVVLKESLTKGERSLVNNGHDDQVLNMRLAFQKAMRHDLIEGVETILDRKVEAFLSSAHLNPDIAIENFLLKPHDR